MNFPTSLIFTWIFTLALAVKLLPEPGSGCHEIADNRVLSTNPRGASDPNVTWKEPGMKFSYIYMPSISHYGWFYPIFWIDFPNNNSREQQHLQVARPALLDAIMQAGRQIGIGQHYKHG